jgi:hypothetical protein
MLSSSAGPSNYGLLLGTPRDKARAKKNAKPGSRTAVIKSTSPVRVTECMEVEGAFGEK